MSTWNKGCATVFGPIIFAAVTQAGVVSATTCEPLWANGLTTCTNFDGSARAEAIGADFNDGRVNNREVRVSLRSGRTAQAGARDANGNIIADCTTPPDTTPTNGSFSFKDCASVDPPARLVINVQ
jgi:hypothetical protein